MLTEQECTAIRIAIEELENQFVITTHVLTGLLKRDELLKIEEQKCPTTNSNPQ